MIWWWITNWRENEKAAHVKLHHLLPLLRQHCITFAGSEKSVRLCHRFASQCDPKADVPSAVTQHRARDRLHNYSGHITGEHCSCQLCGTLTNRGNWNILLFLFYLCGSSSALPVFSSNNSYVWIVFFNILPAKVWLPLSRQVFLVACPAALSLLSYTLLERDTGHSHHTKFMENISESLWSHHSDFSIWKKCSSRRFPRFLSPNLSFFL